MEMNYLIVFSIFLSFKLQASRRYRKRLVKSKSINMVKIIPAPKSYPLFKNNKQDNIISYLYNMFLIFGLYFGFFGVKSGRTKIIMKLIAILQSILINSICFYYTIKNAYGLDLLTFFIQHLICSIEFARLKEGSTLYDITQELRVIDICLKVRNESYNMDLKLMASYALLFLYRTSIMILIAIQHFTVEIIPFALLFLGLDVARFVYSFMFYAINCRLKKLGKLLMNENPDVMTLQFLYKSIVDIAEKFKNDYNIILTVSLMFNVPQSMYLTFITLSVQVPWIDLLSTYMHIIELMTLSIVPAVFAGMLAIEAEKIKIALHNLLLEPRDDASHAEISRFIQYVETRSCRFTLCYILPLDADMLGIVLSFYVTYIIVIVQFTSK